MINRGGMAMSAISGRIKKAVFRLFRILTFRKGIYGKIGKGNRFMKNVLINESCVIGNYNYFGANASAGKTRIGNYCSIAPNVTIGPGDHQPTNVSTCVRVMEKAGVHVDLERDECVIGNDVWIGANVVVLRGVHVGDGAVLAAGAIVNKDIPPYAVAGGVPAKVIKYRFNEDVIRLIQKSEWFLNDDFEKASECVRHLQKQITE